MSVGRHAVAYSQAAITLRPGPGQARITHLPPDAVAGRQRAHYPFTLEPSLPLLLPNPSLHETLWESECNRAGPLVRESTVRTLCVHLRSLLAPMHSERSRGRWTLVGATLLVAFTSLKDRHVVLQRACVGASTSYYRGRHLTDRH